MSQHRQFKTFADAARFARSAAIRKGEDVRLLRDGDAWCVEVPDRETACEIELSDDSHDADWREEQRLLKLDSEVDDIVAEQESYRDDHARAEEDGWYYED